MSGARPNPTAALRQGLQSIVQQATACLLDLPPPVVEAGREPIALQVRRQLALRRRRDGLFPPDLFGEPAWDMLLDLYVAASERRPISVSSACLAAAVPPTTALRYIATLERSGLIEREADPADRRRFHVRVSRQATELIERTYTDQAFELGQSSPPRTDG